MFPLGDRIILERVLNEKVEIIEEPKKMEIPKHIPNEVIQDLDRAICPDNVKCIAHKVNELINYLQYTNKGGEKMSRERAIYFAGLMEEYLNIPSCVCENIENELINEKYYKVINYIIDRKKELEKSDGNE